MSYGFIYRENQLKRKKIKNYRNDATSAILLRRILLLCGCVCGYISFFSILKTESWEKSFKETRKVKFKTFLPFFNPSILIFFYAFQCEGIQLDYSMRNEYSQGTLLRYALLNLRVEKGIINVRINTLGKKMYRHSKMDFDFNIRFGRLVRWLLFSPVTTTS